MLARINRLKGTRSFDKVKKEGSLFQSKSFAIAVLERKDKEPSRFGFIVSNKISKRANARNKIKRVLRETVRTNLPKLKAGFDLVFLVKKPALTKQTKEIREEVSLVFKKANLFR